MRLTQAAEGSFCNNVTRALALFILNGILPALLEAGGSFANRYAGAETTDEAGDGVTAGEGAGAGVSGVSR